MDRPHSDVMGERTRISRYTVGPFEENCYLLVGPSGTKAALVDPGLGSEVVLEELTSAGLELEWIINTHGHVDHVAGNAFFKEHTGAKLIIHPDDEELAARADQQLVSLQLMGVAGGLEAAGSPPADAYFQDGKPFVWDGARFDVLHTPGHSPGGVCLAWAGNVIVGDTLFQGSIGRTDLPGGSYPRLIESIRSKLFRLPGDTVCWPGHGPQTTLAAERRFNPFVSDRATGVLEREQP